MRPIRDVTVFVHAEPFNLGGAIVDLAEIECCIRRWNLLFSDAPLQASKQMLTVGLKDNLDIPVFHNVDENIRQIRLRFRMQMRLRLFENED